MKKRIRPSNHLSLELRARLAEGRLSEAQRELEAVNEALSRSRDELAILDEQVLIARNELTSLSSHRSERDNDSAQQDASSALSLPGIVETLELLRKSEKEARALTRELEELYRNAPIALCVLDRNYRYLRINERMAELNGVPASEHIGRSVRDILPQLADTAEPALQAVFDSGEPAFDIELVGETAAKPGVMRTWLEQWLPIRDGNGHVVALSIVAEEITERKRTEKLLQEAEIRAQQARSAAETANDWKSLFLANMSHEIRTPLAAILGYSDLLAAHLKDPDNLQGVQTIRRNGQHLLSLLNDILDLSRIEAGQLALENEPYSPIGLLREVMELMQVRADERKLELTLQVATELPAELVGDETRLRQILVNLLGNAIKFTEHGGVTLRVMLERDDSTLVFDVIDSGIGITEDQTRTIFDAFAQADESITRRFGGSGLGLAISQRLIKQLGGTIAVQSSPGKGSTFTVALPVTTEELNDLVVSDDVPHKQASRLLIPRSLGCRLLVVDDRVDIRTIVQAILEEAGASVTAVSSGRAALRWVAKAPKDAPIEAIVLDMHMPGLDGYECAAELRRRGYDAPIVALTANAMVGEREKCLAAGCTDYLSKPVVASQLIEMLHRHVEQVPHIEHVPRGIVDAAVSETVDSARSMSTSGESAIANVLLVEDNDDLAQPLIKLLGRRGFAVSWAADVETAWGLALESTPDVVVSDIGLPDGNGYELARRLRKSADMSETVFVSMSGSAADESQADCFDHHLLKPIGAAELVELLLLVTQQTVCES